MTFKDLDAKMRVYEQSLDQIIPPETYLLARIDGRSFTRLIKEICKFETPFDERFSRMMVETVKSLVTDTGMEITYGYTQSDEISLLFDKNAQVFGRKVRKLNSILAGTASARFSLLLGQPAVFDCRIIPPPQPGIGGRLFPLAHGGCPSQLPQFMVLLDLAQGRLERLKSQQRTGTQRNRLQKRTTIPTRYQLQ